MTATHPPLEDRIKAIDPSWNGRFVSNASASASASASTVSRPQSDHSSDSGDKGGLSLIDNDSATAMNFSAQVPSSGYGQPQNSMTSSGISPAVITSKVNNADAVRAVNSDHLVDSVGQIGDQDIDQARNIIERLSGPLLEIARGEQTVQSVIFAVLIDEDKQVAGLQFQRIQARHNDEEVKSVDRVRKLLHNHSPIEILKLLDLSIPVLAQKSIDDYRQIQGTLKDLVQADREVSLFEWVLFSRCMQGIRSRVEKPQASIGTVSIKRLQKEMNYLLSLLAFVGEDTQTQRQSAYQQGASRLNLAKPMMNIGAFNHEEMTAIMTKLKKLKPLDKPALIKACVAVVTHDGLVKADELALVQGIVSLLDCPLSAGVWSGFVFADH